ncbi:MAG: hypothetical protein WCY79_06925 [Bacteroidales bacterium]
MKWQALIRMYSAFIKHSCLLALPIRVEREREERESYLNLHNISYFNLNLLNPFAHPHREARLLHWYNLVVKDVPP